MKYHSLTPAYGRDYASRKAVLADLAAGKDFVHNPDVRVCGAEDFGPDDVLNIRYARLTKVAVFKHPFNK